MAEEENKIILYTTDDGKSQVSLLSRDGRVWLNQKQMAELFGVSKMNISLHIANILKEKELGDSVVKYYFTTAAYKAAI
ncbi:MAG: DNA-binding protein [Kiritimatiellae bacterium]|nr:DNA-binding protein [Kiritimatiellia bacterium]